MSESQEFFDRYPLFLDTTRTRRLPTRLMARHDTIFRRSGVDFRGRTVLDLGSHDGRWSLAALEAGAARVVGIEGRAAMVDDANRTFDSYGIARDRFEFIVGDVVKTLDASIRGPVDVVLNLGFFYHTVQHAEILDRLSALGPDQIVTDTAISTRSGQLLELRVEETADPRMSIDYGRCGRGRVITARPSRDALVLMMDVNGYDTRFHDWLEWPGPWDGIEDYREGTRVTAVSTRRSQRLE